MFILTGPILRGSAGAVSSTFASSFSRRERESEKGTHERSSVLRSQKGAWNDAA